MSVEAAKRQLRREMRELRRRVGPALRQAVGEAVARHVLAWPELRPGRRIALHSALPDEVPTERLMDALLRRGNQLLLPRANEARGLDFARVSDLSILVEGSFGALEPPSCVPSEQLLPDDVVLLPGLAFDATGARLGRGGGWYDRSLPRYVTALFAIAFEFQLVPSVPTTVLDRRVRGVFTERGFHACRVQADVREPSADPS